MSVAVHFRVPADVYDAYARIALSIGATPNQLFREILTIHQPRQAPPV